MGLWTLPFQRSDPGSFLALRPFESLRLTLGNFLRHVPKFDDSGVPRHSSIPPARSKASRNT
eukprot:340503-Hanusia_phi.AAC.1